MSCFSKSISRNKLSITMDSDLDLLPKVVEMTVRFIQNKHAMANLFELRLALFESLANAIKHGNSSIINKQVKFQVSIKGDVLDIIVKDQGIGFDWQELLEDPLSHQPTSSSGRGIYLLTLYKFNPMYNEQGNILFLRKQLPPPGSTDSDHDGL